MSKTYTSKPDLVPTKENPFLPVLTEALTGKVKSKTKGKVVHAENGFVSQSLGVHDLSTGAVLDNETLVVAVKRAVDTEEFVKLFMAGITALFDLSKGAYDVSICLMKSYNLGKLVGTNDLIFFNHREAEEHGYKRKWHSFRSGMNELMSKGFIAPADKGTDWYWINPTLFYRGDRLSIINQYVLNSECKRTTDDRLDQIGLFDGKTERDRLNEKTQS